MTIETELPAVKELKPCPFCGGSELQIHYGDIDGWIAHVECTDCDEMKGPMSEYKYDEQHEAAADAAERWNRRSALTLKDDPGNVGDVEAEPVAWLCISKKTGRRELRFEPIEDLPFNHENWTWTPLFASGDR